MDAGGRANEYGDLGVFGGKAPDPHAIGQQGGVASLRTKHPNVDYFESCAIIESDEKAVIAHSRSSHAADPELVQVETIPPGEIGEGTKTNGPSMGP